MWSCALDGIVQPLMNPSFGFVNFYHSDFNDYRSPTDWWGSPGYLDSWPRICALLVNLHGTDTRNFTFLGHGHAMFFGDGSYPDSDVNVTLALLNQQLGNGYSTSGGWHRQHPYRFVFLYACDTADNTGWSDAFGVFTDITSAQAQAKPNRVQAFVGWSSPTSRPISSTQWSDFGAMQNTFYMSWMQEYNLEDCIIFASDPKVQRFPMPINKLYLDPRDGVHKRMSLVVRGYSKITRSSYEQ